MLSCAERRIWAKKDNLAGDRVKSTVVCVLICVKIIENVYICLYFDKFVL